MRFSELGFDFSNLNTCTVKRKSYLFLYIMFIFSITTVILFITFGILYLTQVSMEVNGSIVFPGDPVYEQFFIIFLAVTGGISALFLLPALLSLFLKPKVYLIKDQDIELNTYHYIYDKRRNREIYLTDNYAFIYQATYNRITKENNPNELEALKQKYIFWYGLENIQDYKLKQKRNTTILKYKEPTQVRFVSRMIRFAFSNEINVVPVKVSKTVNIRTGGNYRTQESVTYFIDDINRQPHFEIHPEIKKALSQEI